MWTTRAEPDACMCSHTRFPTLLIWIYTMTELMSRPASKRGFVFAPALILTLLFATIPASAQQAKSSHGEAATESGWTGAFAQKSQKSFGMAFADDVVLHSTALSLPVVGRERVQAVMGAASKLYEKLEFVDQVTSGRRTWLEWHAVAFGGKKFSGVTVLTRNEKGEIIEASVHHRPRWAALMFGEELRTRLPELLTPDYYSAVDRP